MHVPHVVTGLLCRHYFCGAREEHPGSEAQQHGARRVLLETTKR